MKVEIQSTSIITAVLQLTYEIRDPRLLAWDECATVSIHNMEYPPEKLASVCNHHLLSTLL